MRTTKSSTDCSARRPTASASRPEWLDAARFADTDGYHDDEYQRRLYPWRDWVIAAFNSNMPYDRVRASAQLAGDLLDEATKAQQDRHGSSVAIASVARPRAASSPRRYRVEYVIDRADDRGHRIRSA